MKVAELPRVLERRPPSLKRPPSAPLPLDVEYIQTHSNQNTKRIESIQFGTLSPLDMLAESCVEVTSSLLHDMTTSGPVWMGVLDPRMGVSGKMEKCKTCNKNMLECEGHFGIIRLVAPVWHPGYFNLVLQILQSICKKCSRVLVFGKERDDYLRKAKDPSKDSTDKASVRRRVLEYCKKQTTCPYCASPVGPIRRAPNSLAPRIFHDAYQNRAFQKGLNERNVARFENVGRIVGIAAHMAGPLDAAPVTITPKDALELMSRIPLEDLPLLWCHAEYAKPENMILSSVLVPPVCIRPSVKTESGAQGSQEDDLTIKLQEIVGLNMNLDKLLKNGGQSGQLMEMHDNLTNAVAMFIDGESTPSSSAMASSSAAAAAATDLTKEVVLSKSSKKRFGGLGVVLSALDRASLLPPPAPEPTQQAEEDEDSDSDSDEENGPKAPRSKSRPAAMSHNEVHPDFSASALDAKTSASKLAQDSLSLSVKGMGGMGASGAHHHHKAPSKRVIRGLVQRIKGKQGRFRGNLSGKRVDFSGRTVISPDPNLGIDQVGVPEKMAMRLTFPEHVRPDNIEVMREKVERGANIHPGANMLRTRAIDPQTGQAYVTTKYIFDKGPEFASQLKVGDIVERHLQDGDIVLFNRQPSLHRQSIMAHEVRVLEGHTLRFNECVCAPYNADFDGDEMNIHLPQTSEARAEAFGLMAVPHNLVTPRNGDPLVSATQDFVTGSHMLTRRDVFLTRKEFVQVVYGADDCLTTVEIPAPAILHPTPLWTGKQAWSTMLRDVRNVKDDENVRPGVCIIAKERGYKDTRLGAQEDAGDPMCNEEGFVEFRDSTLMCGAIGKSSLGSSKTSVFYAALRDVSEVAATKAMNRMTKMVTRWLFGRGFSFGIDDVRPTTHMLAAKQQVIEDGFAKVRFEQRSASLLKEPKIANLLSTVREDVGKHASRALSHFNSAVVMNNCGSKGSTLNIVQMIACVGQQVVGGARILEGFSRRALPHFPRDTTEPESNGFVKSSFYSGLDGCEFFFHTMAGREGLVDTAVKTAETGYMARRLMKALEDLSVQYDGTVRDSTTGIVQFTYGDDGLNPSLMESDGHAIDYSRLIRRITSTEETKEEASWLTHEEILATLPGLVQWADAQLVALAGGCSRASNESRDPARFYLECVRGSAPPEKDYGRVRFLRSMERELGQRLRHLRVSRTQLEAFVKSAVASCARAIAPPGEAVGAIGAQSLGEPGTQMTLKTFHFAGVASMNVTLGVPRLKEIINASKAISTPIISIQLVRPFDLTEAQRVKSSLEATTLGDVCRGTTKSWCSDHPRVEFHLDPDAIEKLALTGLVDARRVSERLLREAVKLKIRTIKQSLTMKKSAYSTRSAPEFAVNPALDNPNAVVIDYFPTTPPKTRVKPQEVFAREGDDSDAKTDAGSAGVRFGVHRLQTEAKRVIVAGIPGIGKTVITETSLNQIERESNLRRLHKWSWENPEYADSDVVKSLESFHASYMKDYNAKAAQSMVHTKATEGKCYSIMAEGRALLAVLGVEGVDWTKTRTNDIMETERVLGIEAARATICSEIRFIFERYGLSIDQRHLLLLSDVMTYRGMVLGITRFGIAKMKESVLLLASFERTADHLFDGAAHGRVDEIRGVSECVVIGAPIPLGTGAFKILSSEIYATQA